MLSIMSAHGKNVAVSEQPTNYISNMMLPEKVRATRLHPLGPDCIISKNEVTDQATLKKVQYYWCVSRDKGCVECVMKKPKGQTTVTASDPRCVVTKKHRRFEAYCCMVCRTNFVTILQALLHLKATHRPNNKILIQDKDVFNNLDKALEVPPVPLPWHVAKKMVDKSYDVSTTTPTPTYVIPPGALAPSTIADTIIMSNLDSSASQYAYPLKATTNQSPMAGILTAITEAFHKQVKHLHFKEDCSEANAIFDDGSNVVVKIPDFSPTAMAKIDSLKTENSDEPLTFHVDKQDLVENGSENPLVEQEILIRSNKPHYAKMLLAKCISAAALAMENREKRVDESSTTTTKESPAVESDSETPKAKILKSSGKKSVRFVLGAPESDDERPRTPDVFVTSSAFHDDSVKHPTTEVPSIKVSEVVDKPSKENEDGSFDGLRMVIDNLISTASKGRIIAPTSPIPSSLSAASLPHVGSSPALFNMTIPSSSNNQTSLTRVQSWSPSVAPIPFSVANMRRPYTARGFTYAEKIQFMKQQNDYDAEFVNKHISSKLSKSNGKAKLKTSSDEDLNALKHHSVPGQKEREDGSKDGDTQESNLMENAATMAALYSLLQKGLVSSSFFPSEYYGSGEWANAALESLKSLQPMLKSQEELMSPRSSANETSPVSVRKSVDKSSRSFSSNSGDIESLSDDNMPSSLKPFVKTRLRDRCKNNNARKRCLSSNESSYIDDESTMFSKRKKYKTGFRFENENSVDFQDADLISEMFEKTRGEDESAYRESPPSKQSNFEKFSIHTKVPLSPLLSDSEKDHFQHHHTSRSKTEMSPPLATASVESKPKNPVVSNLTSKTMGAKCSSDSALSSSVSPEHLQYPAVNHNDSRAIATSSDTVPIKSASSLQENLKDTVLHVKDELQLVSNVTLDDFHQQRSFTARLKKSKQSASDDSKVLTNMPEMFQSCIDTYVQLKCVKKLLTCKVCGFSVDIMDHDEENTDGKTPSSILEAHVMEHSLKELYATNYDAPKW